MKTHSGFISAGTLIAVLFSLVVAGGVYYVVEPRLSTPPLVEDQSEEQGESAVSSSNVSIQNEASVTWTMGAKADDSFNYARVTLRLSDGSVRSADLKVRNDCKELNQQNLKDEYLQKVDAAAVLDAQPNLIKPGLACVGWDNFSWYGVFSEDGKYVVKNIADNGSGLGAAWNIIKEITSGGNSSSGELNMNADIKIISPNGGEILKLGKTTLIAWNAQNVPPGAQLHLELFEITGDRPAYGPNGECLNCTESGLRSGKFVGSISEGVGSTEWIAGEQYDHASVKPGSRYIMQAFLSKDGRADAGECPSGSFKGTCQVLRKIDWSDAPFSLIE